MGKVFLVLSITIPLILGSNTLAEEKELPDIDLIVVEKSKRVLHLMKHWQSVRTFKISLGQFPTGPKQYEGDSRTPEGFYQIDGRNPDSKFFRALHISYPNPIDRYMAKRSGRNPGGDIMIHGEPNDPKLRKNLKKDWTQGCIGLRNRDMAVVWEIVKEGTPVLIKP